MYLSLTLLRENKGTERDNQGVGWDMSIPLKLILTLDGKDVCFPRHPHSVELISNCKLSLNKYHLPYFTKSFSSTKLIYTTLSSI